MVPLDAGIGSLGNWKQLGFVAPDAKAMMDRLTAVGFGPFKVYHVDSGDWEGVTYRGAPAERYALEVCMATGTWDVEIIVPIPGGGRTIYGEYLAQQPAGGLHHIGAYLAADQYDAAYRYLEGIGYAQIQGGPILGIDRNGRYDYFAAIARSPWSGNRRSRPYASGSGCPFFCRRSPPGSSGRHRSTTCACGGPSSMRSASGRASSTTRSRPPGSNTNAGVHPGPARGDQDLQPVLRSAPSSAG